MALRSTLTGFRDVDAASAPADLIRYLQEVSEVPLMRQRAAARLARSGITGGQTVADLGCALGGDMIMLARHVASGGGRAIGLGRSRTMLDRAAARPEAAGLPTSSGRETSGYPPSLTGASTRVGWSGC
jgi:hypothetical protein